MKILLFEISATTLSVTTFSIEGHKGLFATLSIPTLCHYAVRCCAECHILFIVMLNAVMLSAIMPSVVAPKNQIITIKILRT